MKSADRNQMPQTVLAIKTVPLRFLDVALDNLPMNGARPRVTVIAPEGELNTLRADPRISEVIPLTGQSSVREYVSLLFKMRRRRFDLSLVMYGYLEEHCPPLVELAALGAGAKRATAFDMPKLRFCNLNLFHLIWSLRKRIPKGTLQFWLSTISRWLKMPYVLGKPVYLTLEPTTACNARCPVCETGDGSLQRPTAMMKYEDYVRIIDDLAPHTNTMLLYFMGESFLHKRIYEMIQYAKSKRIVVTAATNGDFVDPIKVVDSGIDLLEFQLGGVTQKTHETYRVNSNLERGVNNARAMIAERNRRGLTVPVVTFNLIVMKHNEDEIEAFRQLAADIGADECMLITPTVRTTEQAAQFLPTNDLFVMFDRPALEKGKLRLRQELYPNNRCDWLFYSTIVTAHGDVVPCCRDPHGLYTMGNVVEEGFGKIWNNKKYREFRKMILTNQKKSKICALCSSYPAPILR